MNAMRKLIIFICVTVVLIWGVSSPLQAQRTTFKSWMDYRTITNRRSVQWDLQQRAITDEQGLRRYVGRYDDLDMFMVAIGTGWGFSVGDTIYIELSSGKTILAVVGDIKDDRHTCNDNIFTVINGCQLEFVVCARNLCPTVRRRGDVSFAGFDGYIMSIISWYEVHKGVANEGC